MSIRMQVLALADGSEVPQPCYLAAIDHEGNDGLGRIELTDNPAYAHLWPDMTQAIAAYQRVPRCRPIRPDGQPNKPLTAFTVTLQTAE